MFALNTREGKHLLMKNGRPFLYSSRETATTARRLLELEHKQPLVVVEVS